jgi:hypothetical protein
MPTLPRLSQPASRSSRITHEQAAHQHRRLSPTVRAALAAGRSGHPGGPIRLSTERHAIMAHPQRRPATYQDIIDLPKHLVGEIIAGELHTQPRPAPRYARASSVVGGKLTGPFDAGMLGPGAGGSWTSRNCIWGRISWCRIWRAGGGSGCRGCRVWRGSSWLRTGRARCCRRVLPARTG